MLSENFLSSEIGQRIFFYIVCYLTLFLTEFYVSISVPVFVAVDFFFSVSPTTNPCYPQHLVSGFVLIKFCFAVAFR